MAFVAVATGGAALIGGATGLIGAGMQAGAAKDAANTQAGAARYAADLQNQQYQQQRTDQEPWRQAGATALTQMQDPSFQKTYSGADLQSDPGYQFRMQQGQNAIERSAAARGGLQSGGTLQAIANYGQDYASNEYQNAYNRFNNDQTTRFNRLSSLAGVGQTANAQLGAAGQNYANQAGSAAMGAANAQGSAGIAGANAWGGAMSSLGSAASGGINNYMQYSMMNKYMNGGGSGGGYGGGGSDGTNIPMGAGQAVYEG